MRWPLRYQIMVPMAAVMLLAVVFVEGVGALLAVRDTESQIAAQIHEVARIAAEANFPLTAPVLRQMKALSGAELIVVDDQGRTNATSGPLGDVHGLSNDATPHTLAGLSGSERVELQDRSYFHTVVSTPALGGDGSARLHILFPEAEYQRAWQREVYPPLGFMVVALPIVLVLSHVTASRIAARVGRLHQQVDRIAHGEFQQFALPDGDDEIRALAGAVNRMAGMLAGYAEEVRRTERMRTLAHLGGGIAHQLRNSATGCAMAVDLHADECPLGEASETLAVAKRQLRLMEQYIQRFLQLGKSSETPAMQSIDLAALVEDLLPLVEPSARHAGVELVWRRGDGAAIVPGNAERLGQTVINLLVNAIEAAAQAGARAGSPARVCIELARKSPECVTLSVADTGSGPADDVQQTLFDPFVTGKPDGVGLGLSVAREIVEQHGGRIAWHRADQMTYFTVELPTEAAEARCVETAGCR
ncbi:MAG: HAMP domain-containing sensor histidine kinase [Pirellulales bacterium]